MERVGLAATKLAGFPVNEMCPRCGMEPETATHRCWQCHQNIALQHLWTPATILAQEDGEAEEEISTSKVEKTQISIDPFDFMDANERDPDGPPVWEEAELQGIQEYLDGKVAAAEPEESLRPAPGQVREANPFTATAKLALLANKETSEGKNLCSGTEASSPSTLFSQRCPRRQRTTRLETSTGLRRAASKKYM